ncbi:MAG: RluA family pseudouridine synthase [Gemmatimonadetes bacterium]|nr:RluA family pseudouridine synthase [Gemmatimonadota bacterium]MBT7859194.1 RluA family pseudouridine synthase [Gemmatimonadota bacterium]
MPPDLRHRPLSIVHQEDSFVVVDKLPDFLSVPGRGPDLTDCVVNRIRELFPRCEGSLAAHRLDMETSGLMVLGLTPAAHRHLSRQFEERHVRKAYVALLEGHVAEDAGHIELAFRVDIDNRPRQILDPVHGKLGITDWKVVTRETDHTRVRFTPLTGRTHQLRVHAAHPDGLGHPVLGDRLYGNPRLADRLMLHSARLAFHHPETDQWLEFELPAPF